MPIGNSLQRTPQVYEASTRNHTKMSHRHRYSDVQDLLRQFVVVQTLSEGSTAEVFLARERATGMLVAVKEQRLDRLDTAFLDREAALHSVLRHPHIVTLFESAKNEEVMVLIQEFLGGGELYNSVVPDIGVHPLVVRRYFTHIVSAVRYMHSVDVAHRDIKLENVCLDSCKETAKLIDFGLSEYVNGSPNARYKRHVGTVPYMAAELWYNPDQTYVNVDVKATDVWALGVLLFCMLVGRFPWGEASHRSKEYQRYLSGDFSQKPWSSIPDVQLTLLTHMLDVNPASRWTSAEVEHYVFTHWPPVRPLGSKRRSKQTEVSNVAMRRNDSCNWSEYTNCSESTTDQFEQDNRSDYGPGLGDTQRLDGGSDIESIYASSITLPSANSPIL